MSLRIQNLEFIREALKTPHPRCKFLLNEEGVVFFPESQQHRSIKVPGLSYEDDYRGNAVAGLLIGDQVEIRFHSAFSDQRISLLWAQVAATVTAAGINLGPPSLKYQGRQLQ
ncbi:MAG: hypothetical protein H2172_08495 [Opitutus sp.]|nr:hypothetical protein [Opitutus sp.]MCS6246554.1 hypothetical protein [Opitutus sp.]MCS6272761.1 hypothetical protein [Opitutus sp.]MCS6276393.1 hypothetical protein [Opitutus sp.]MCS6301959.1 hypothetical protein [Opitutus sp.]